MHTTQNHNMTASEVRYRIVYALTQYDIKQPDKRGYNPYALGHYCRAAQDIEESITAGRSAREAIMTALCGNLANLALRAIGEPKFTDVERDKFHRVRL